MPKLRVQPRVPAKQGDEELKLAALTREEGRARCARIREAGAAPLALGDRDRGIARVVGDLMIPDDTDANGFVEYRNLCELGGFDASGPIAIADILARVGAGGGGLLGGGTSEKAKQVRARCGSASNCASAACTIAGDAVTRKNTAIVRAVKGYDAVLADVVALIDAGRRASIRTTNAIMTATYWGVGRASRDSPDSVWTIRGRRERRECLDVSRQFLKPEEIALVASRLRLPWSCYVRLLSVRNPEAQRFYEAEALCGGWTVR